MEFLECSITTESGKEIRLNSKGEIRIKDKLIKNFLRDQEVVVRDENDKIVAIGKVVNETDCLLYELSSDRFYINSDNEEYYCDDLLQIIFQALEQ